jgi:hypothetical protein
MRKPGLHRYNTVSNLTILFLPVLLLYVLSHVIVIHGTSIARPWAELALEPVPYLKAREWGTMIREWER